MDKLNQPKVKRMLSQMSSHYSGLYIRALEKKCSPRQAIKAFCQQCMGYQEAKSRIRDCDSQSCPLWEFRPYQDMGKSLSEEEITDTTDEVDIDLF